MAYIPNKQKKESRWWESLL